MHIRHGWRSLFISFLVLFFVQNKVQAGDFCSRSPEEILKQFESPKNRIAFRNMGGLNNGGVCWWHSRLQRSAIYLSEFAPTKSKPTESEALKIVRQLVYFSGVVEIPGYENFSEFSQDFASIIQKELDRWQIRDAFINQQWIRGLHGRSTMAPEDLELHMNALYEKFLTAEPGMWTMAQMKGISSHALLFLGMTKTDLGYQLRVIDSNLPNATRELEYHFGDETIDLADDHFIPYLGFQNDQKSINQTLKRYCNP